MAKPPNNTPSISGSPKTDDDTHEEHQDKVPMNVSFQWLASNQEEIVRLERQITEDRKKWARADVSVSSLKGNIQLWLGKLESSEATRLAANKKRKGEIDGLKIEEKAALRAASTSSKLVGDASRDSVFQNVKC
jgi:hypothetical protein